MSIQGSCKFWLAHWDHSLKVSSTKKEKLMGIQLVLPLGKEEDYDRYADLGGKESFSLCNHYCIL